MSFYRRVQQHMTIELMQDGAPDLSEFSVRVGLLARASFFQDAPADFPRSASLVGGIVDYRGLRFTFDALPGHSDAIITCGGAELARVRPLSDL